MDYQIAVAFVLVAVLTFVFTVAEASKYRVGEDEYKPIRLDIAAV